MSEIKADEKFFAALKDDLLNCDKIRVNLDAYDANLLTDPNRGHWDLWDLTAADNEGQVILTEGVKRENYENPTVIEFIHLKNFEDAYFAKPGRPLTKWEDVTVSHTAMTNLINTTDSRNYYSFLENIKQWCGAARKNIRLRDQNGEERELPGFMDIMENQLNPPEIYAYYRGLYINHMMQEKHIFMEYILSFPVTYERNIREKMLLNFKSGLKKFRVVEGTSEPAAYAITALEGYKFPRDGEDEIYYAVFDFGGDTTNLGVYCYSDEDRYDYVLTHFGANGDRTLGGG